MSVSNETEAQGEHGAHAAMENLRRMRDEVRLEVHLGGMEAKTRWAELEKEFIHLERLGRTLSRRAVEDVTERLREFREGLKTTH